MFRKLVLLSLAVVFVISLSGCATARKQKDSETQGLKNQVSLLESRLQSKDEEISSLRQALTAKAEKETSQAAAVIEAWSRPKTKDIQRALLGAGYNPGPVDGKMGRQTREAIREFQKANNLNPDGKVGRKTWALLRGYLEKKVK